MLVAAVFVLILSQAQGAPAPRSGGAAGPLTYDSFQLVHTRNVFDPDRKPILPTGNGTPAPAPSTQAEYAALTGTMLTGEKSYAFFSGSRPEFNRVLSVRDKIANATITGITPQSIEVERDGKHTTVGVGQTVPLDNQSVPGTAPVVAEGSGASAGGGGVISGGLSASASATGTGTTSNATPRPAPASSPPTNGNKPPPANLDEIRRRMIEKRQQELK